MSTAVHQPHVPDELKHHHRHQPEHRQFGQSPVSHRRTDPFREDLERPNMRPNHLMQSNTDGRLGHHQGSLNHRHEQHLKHHHQQHRPRFHATENEHLRQRPSCKYKELVRVKGSR